ncbi:hypothetical protein GCM10009609_74830 [Pseudonocardia aurantiaca]
MGSRLCYPDHPIRGWHTLRDWNGNNQRGWMSAGGSDPRMEVGTGLTTSRPKCQETRTKAALRVFGVVHSRYVLIVGSRHMGCRPGGHYGRTTRSTKAVPWPM